MTLRAKIDLAFLSVIALGVSLQAHFALFLHRPRHLEHCSVKSVSVSQALPKRSLTQSIKAGRQNTNTRILIIIVSLSS